MNDRMKELLRTVTERESRSLLQYVADAFPWTTTRGQGSAQALFDIVKEDLASLNSLVRFLGRNKIKLPQMGAYPSAFTSMNFISLSRLRTLLLEAQQRAIADLERDLATSDDDSVRTLFQALLDLKRRHLHRLETLDPVEEKLTLAAAGG